MTIVLMRRRTGHAGLLPLRRFWLASIVALVAHRTVAAQTRAVPVHGVAFDNLRKAPLSSALVTLVGRAKNTTTDDRGRFQFDSVSPGMHTFVVQHTILDTIGLSGLSTRANITNGREQVRIVLPSFAELWSAACGRSPAPADSGFVYGTVRDARGLNGVRGAVVELNWTELVMEKKQVVQRRWRTSAVSDSSGSFAVCGVSMKDWLRIRAVRDSVSTDWIDVAPNHLRVQRRNLAIANSRDGDSAGRGTVAGVVTGRLGAAIPEARVRILGQGETRTGPDGRFTLRAVMPGTRQLEVSAVGAVPSTQAVDVTSGDTTVLALQLDAVMLDGTRVTAARTGRTLATEFDARRRSGGGFTMDSLQIRRYQAFHEVLLAFPSVRLERRRSSLTIAMPNGRGTCTPQVFIDATEAGFNHLIDLQPNEVAGVEVYSRATSVPAKFVRAGTTPECGVILVWTKYGFLQR